MHPRRSIKLCERAKGFVVIGSFQPYFANHDGKWEMLGPTRIPHVSSQDYGTKKSISCVEEQMHSAVETWHSAVETRQSDMPYSLESASDLAIDGAHTVDRDSVSNDAIHYRK